MNFMSLTQDLIKLCSLSDEFKLTRHKLSKICVSDFFATIHDIHSLKNKLSLINVKLVLGFIIRKSLKTLEKKKKA